MDASIGVLLAASPAEKCARAASIGRRIASGALFELPKGEAPPDRPGRPDRPLLKAPKDVPRRRLGSPEGRIALLHAIAHIEFNAIDLAFDMVVRFTADVAALGLDAQRFAVDWAGVGVEEGVHFSMVAERLHALGGAYGDLPAHDGLWDAAFKTRKDVLPRLVVAPLILEARGLDVTPGMIEKLNHAGDAESAAVLQRIYDDEIGHVAAGERWFHDICKAKNVNAEETFRDLQHTYFPAGTKPPFNHQARMMAGLPRRYYDAQK